MEIAAAVIGSLVGSVATAALSKLTTVINKKLSSGTEAREDAEEIHDELRSITFILETGLSGPGSPVKAEWFAKLRRLAYDMEDSIDRFNANKLTPEAFTIEIAKLKKRSRETTHEMHRLMTAGRASVVSNSNDPPDFLLGDKSCHACLAYFYLFPPKHDVRTKSLTRRWLAEGLVDGEQVAVNNLSSIIDSGHINSTSIQRSNNGKVKKCQPTAKTLEDIAKLSSAENFILVYDGSTQLPAEGPRRLAVHRPANARLKLPHKLSRHRLRTLAVFPTGGGGGAPAALARDEAVLDFSRYEVLRVLDLKECAHLSDGHIQAICKQVLMKYLSINLDRIPRAIRHLNQLETLDLSGSEIVTVYKEVLLLPELKHLLGKFQLSRTDMFSVPVLGLFGSDLERFLRKQSKLETLAGFVTGERYGFPQLMSFMMRLRKVKIWCKSNASERNLCVLSTAITKFIRGSPDEPDLNRSLSIDFKATSGEFVNGIKAGDGKLDSLKLHGQLNKFPQFVERLAIEELCLCSTGLSWELIRNGLSNVKGLQYLELVEDKLGRIEIEPQHLNSIKRICMACKTILDIEIQAGALPHLVSLHILCENLNVVPGSGIEITHMTKLKEVALHPDVDGAIRTQWKQGVNGHPNEPVPVLLSIQGP